MREIVYLFWPLYVYYKLFTFHFTVLHDHTYRFTVCQKIPKYCPVDNFFYLFLFSFCLSLYLNKNQYILGCWAKAEVMARWRSFPGYIGFFTHTSEPFSRRNMLGIWSDHSNCICSVTVEIERYCSPKEVGKTDRFISVLKLWTFMHGFYFILRNNCKQ